MIRGMHLILLGCSWLYAPQVRVWQAASGVGVCTPFRALLTEGTTVLVPGLLKLYMYGRIHDTGMGPYPPRVTLALRIQGWGLAMSL